MIEVKVKGPQKQNIIDFLRRKSKADKDTIQMLRLKYDCMTNEQSKVLSKINLPTISKQVRKNDIPKSMPFSFANKVAQMNHSIDTQTIDISRVSIELENKSPQRKTLQRKVKSHLEMIRPLNRSEQVIKSTHNQKKHSKQKMVTILSEHVKKHLSIDFKNKPESIQKVSKSLLFYLSSSQQKSKPHGLPKPQEYFKQFCSLETIESPNKRKITEVSKFLEQKMVLKQSKVLKIKTEGSQQLRSHILKKIRSKQTQSKLKVPKLLSLDEIPTRQEILKDCYETKSPFQKSLGPWKDNAFTFEV